MITPEDAKNLLALVNRVANITGQEAPTVADLQKKLIEIMGTKTEVVEPEKVETPE